jgi:hypothetical protein
MKDGLGTLVQLAGFACVVWAAFLIAVPLGLVALGAVLIPAGHVLDGFDWRKARRDWRRRRRGMRRVS